MEMKVDRLREAMKLIQPVILKKPTLEIVKNVYLGDGKVIGSNLETAIVVDLIEADTPCLLPHREVLDLLKNVHGYNTLNIKMNKKTVKLDWGAGNASYEVKDPSDYPDLPKFKPTIEGSVDGDLLVKALVSMVPFCSNDETRTTLTGVAMHIDEDKIVVVGADGYRLAYQSLPIALKTQQRAIIPAHSVSVLQGLWKLRPGSVEAEGDLISQLVGTRNMHVSMNGGYFSARFGEITHINKLIEGSPPEYRNILPKVEDLPLVVQFFASELERGLQSAKLLVLGNGDIVRLMWDSETMTIAAKHGNNEVESKISLHQVEGGEGKTAMNIGYLLGYVKGKDGIVTMRVNTPSTPIQFEYRSSPTVVMMPMHVAWPGEKENKAGDEEQKSGEEVAVGEAGSKVKKKGSKKK